MVTSRWNSVTRVSRKLASAASIVGSNPKLLPLMRQGVHPEIYSRLNGAWLRDGNIKTVLDIGANTGQFSRTIHALLPEATVYAFEPQGDCFAAIERSFAGINNLYAIQTAVGDEDGEIIFHRNEYSQSSSVLPMTDIHKEAFPFAQQSRQTQVPISRLDSLASNIALNPSILVKIDVQGYEDKVLLGGEAVMRKADFVIIETGFEQLYEGEASFHRVYTILLNYGFHYVGNLDQTINPANDRPLYADALFVRSI